MKRTLVSLLLLLVAVQAASAQESKTSFFLDHDLYAWRVNPGAQFGDAPHSFFSLGTGYSSASFLASFNSPRLKLKAIPLLFSNWDDMIAGLETLGSNTKFDFRNYMLASASYNILSFGRQWESTRFSVSVNMRTDNSMRADFDFLTDVLFSPDLKRISGMVGVSNTGFRSFNYLEAALGLGQKLGDMVTMGASVKFLLGTLGMGVDINNLRIGVQPDETLGANMDAEMYFSSTLLKLGTMSWEGREVYDFSTASLGKTGFSGIGAAVDLGLTVRPLDELTLGVSVLDLGFINWKEGFDAFLSYNGRIVESLKDIFALEMQPRNARCKMLNYNIHTSVQYRMPFYDGLCVGVLGTFQQYFTEGRLGLTLTPWKWLSLAASAALNNFGGNLGAAINFRLPGVYLFVAADSFDLGPRMTNYSAGFSLAF